MLPPRWRIFPLSPASGLPVPPVVPPGSGRTPHCLPFHPQGPEVYGHVCRSSCLPASLLSAANTLRGGDLAGPVGGERHPVFILEQCSPCTADKWSLRPLTALWLSPSSSHVGSASLSVKWGTNPHPPDQETSAQRGCDLLRSHNFHSRLIPKPHRTN